MLGLDHFSIGAISSQIINFDLVCKLNFIIFLNSLQLQTPFSIIQFHSNQFKSHLNIANIS